jgi:hypothetical protein
MPTWPAWVMGFFIFGAVRYAAGTFIPTDVGGQLISYAISAVSALMIVGLAGRLFVFHR